MHRVLNKTLEYLDVCCIDIGCPTIQSAYVMLSRVRRLKGLCILRPFGLQRIRNHISEELRTELKRTNLKAKITKAYSRERLSWFYSLVPEGKVSLLTWRGVTVDKTVQGGGNAPYVFKIQGALYHKVGSLLPEPWLPSCSQIFKCHQKVTGSIPTLWYLCVMAFPPWTTSLALTGFIW
ncbi:hypothetical protein B0H10DRAFT_2323715 [Mycena sp. CBHHK59/15]|nr:hypothetical protein B0H10DRAFT_2323715 [Mycena sp. CBHHK59/15]